MLCLDDGVVGWPVKTPVKLGSRRWISTRPAGISSRRSLARKPTGITRLRRRLRFARLTPPPERICIVCASASRAAVQIKQKSEERDQRLAGLRKLHPCWHAFRSIHYGSHSLCEPAGLIRKTPSLVICRKPS